MRMPRVRFTVRRLIVAIAVVAILLAFSPQIRRTIHYSRLSAGFARRAAMYDEYESIWREDERKWREREEDDRQLADQSDLRSVADFWREQAERSAERAEKRKALADYNASMKAKYHVAARRPWLGVQPNPVPPEVSARPPWLTSPPDPAPPEL
jgi:hypothetical protein